MTHVCIKCETVLNNGEDIQVNYHYVYLVVINGSRVYELPVYICKQCVNELRQFHHNVKFNEWNFGEYGRKFYKRYEGIRLRNTDSLRFLELKQIKEI